MNPSSKAAVATADLEEQENDPSSALYGDGEGDDEEELAVLRAERAAADEQKAAKAAKAEAAERKGRTAAPAEEPSQGVNYVILEGIEEDEGISYREVRRVAARNAQDAARHAVEGYEGTDPITILAVPERSFRPLKITVKVERTFSVE